MQPYEIAGNSERSLTLILTFHTGGGNFTLSPLEIYTPCVGD